MIGEGIEGEVYLANDRATGQRVAIKLVRRRVCVRGVGGDPCFWMRAKRARLPVVGCWRELQTHPNAPPFQTKQQHHNNQITRNDELGLGPEKTRREIQLQARLSHANIVELKRVVLTRHHLGIVMGYEAGGDLHGFCSRYKMDEVRGVGGGGDRRRRRRRRLRCRVLLYRARCVRACTCANAPAPPPPTYKRRQRQPPLNSLYLSKNQTKTKTVQQNKQ
jgi:hypothetical protein